MKTRQVGPVLVIVCCRAPGPINAGHNLVSRCQCRSCREERDEAPDGDTQTELALLGA